MRFLRALKWDITLQLRHHVYSVTFFTTLVLCGIIRLFPQEGSINLVLLMIFIEPIAIGFTFVGSIMLMEKAAGTTQAIGVTPLPARHYIASKVISLTLLTFGSGMIVATAGLGTTYHPFAMLIALGLGSLFGVLTGFAIAARSPSLNKFLTSVSLISIALYIPLVAHMGLLSGPLTWLFAPIPTHAILVLLRLTVQPAQVSLLEAAYAFLFLGFCVFLAWRWCEIEYRRTLITSGQ